jgi:hypothetical protein
MAMPRTERWVSRKSLGLTPRGDEPRPHAKAVMLDVLGTSIRVTGLGGASRRQFVELAQGFVSDERNGPHHDLSLRLRRQLDDGRWITSCDGKDVSTFADLAVALPQLEWQAIARGVDASSEYGVFHAASLTRNATNIIIVASSGSGKTTVTLELLRLGWLPFADDITVLDADTLALRPFPRSFHTDSAEVQARVVAPWARPVSGMTGYSRPTQWASAGGAPTVVVLMSRDAGESSALSPITRAEAAGALLAEAVRSRVSRRTMAEISARVAASVEATFRLNNGDLRETLALLSGLS